MKSTSTFSLLKLFITTKKFTYFEYAKYKFPYWPFANTFSGWKSNLAAKSVFFFLAVVSFILLSVLKMLFDLKKFGFVMIDWEHLLRLESKFIEFIGVVKSESLLHKTTLKFRLWICILDLLFSLLLFSREVGVTMRGLTPNFFVPEPLRFKNYLLLLLASFDPLYEGI